MLVFTNMTMVIELLLLFSLGVNAQKVGVKSELGYGCFNCALNWNFDCPNEVLPFTCRCSREDFLTTAMECVVEHAANVDEVAKGWWFIRDQCHYWGSRTMSIEEMQAIYENRKHSLVDASDAFNSTIAPGPVRVPDVLLQSQMVAAHDTKYHYNVGNYFAWAIVGYWGFVVTGAAIMNAIRILCPEIYSAFPYRSVTRLRKFFTLPALIGNRHQSPYQLNRYMTLRLPTRGQFIIVLGFVALNIASIVAFLGVEGDSPLAFTSQSDRKLHYLANRTGIIAFGHIPILVLFACRNNPFIWLTGWPYDTFMMYHRWLARFMGIHAIIHSVAIYWSSINEKVVIFKWENVHNWRGGNLAVYMVIFMLTLALRTVRTRAYELFKATHVVMFLIFIICLIVHCSDYGWLGWLWTAVAFYGIEYICRISAVLLSGGIQTAEFTLTEAGMYRVKVPGAHRKWDIKPGGYVYIRILEKDMFWQSHPFSIFQGQASASDNALELCCKAQLGATRKVFEHLLDSPESKFTRKVMIEGPYGHENYVCDYESILLFAGGVGFTAMYNFAANLLKNLKPNQRVALAWVIRDLKHLRAFENDLALLARQNSDIFTFRIFVTSVDASDLGTVGMTEGSQSEKEAREAGSLAGSLSSETSTKAGSTSKDSIHVQVAEDKMRCSRDDSYDAPRLLVDGDVLLNVEYGRPDISTEVADFIRVANGSKAICSCGPPMFVDAIRAGIVESIMDSDSRVDYFEEAFSW